MKIANCDINDITLNEIKEVKEKHKLIFYNKKKPFNISKRKRLFSRAIKITPIYSGTGNER
jgi:hypothetical protein